MPRLTKTEKTGLLSLGKRRKWLRSICTDKSFFIEPNTDARMDFIEKYVPKWMKQNGNDIWAVGHRLAEEIEENFQFVPDWQNLPKDQPHNGLLRERLSLAHILVVQQLMINSLLKNYKKVIKMHNKLTAEKTKSIHRKKEGRVVTDVMKPL